MLNKKNSDQGILLFAAFDCRIDDKVEEFFDGQNVDLLFAEELVHVGQVLAQELQGVGVIVFDRLRYVNDVSLSLVVQQVELALKICMKNIVKNKVVPDFRDICGLNRTRFRFVIK